MSSRGLDWTWAGLRVELVTSTPCHRNLKSIGRSRALSERGRPLLCSRRGELSRLIIEIFHDVDGLMF